MSDQYEMTPLAHHAIQAWRVRNFEALPPARHWWWKALAWDAQLPKPTEADVITARRVIYLHGRNPVITEADIAWELDDAKEMLASNIYEASARRRKMAAIVNVLLRNPGLSMDEAAQKAGVKAPSPTTQSLIRFELARRRR